jgi:hypothetical protein
MPKYKKIINPTRNVAREIAAAVNAFGGRIFKSIMILLLKGARGFIFPDNKSIM